MRRRIRFVSFLSLALVLGGAPLHAQPASPPAALGSVLAQANADLAAKRFSAAVALLQSQPTVKTDATLRHALADAQYAWGRDLLIHSQYADAILHYQAAYALNKGDRPDKSGDDLRFMGACCESLSQYARAIDFDRQALTIQKKAGDRKGEAIDLNNLAVAYEDLSQYAKAIDLDQQALAVRRQMGDRKGEAAVLTNLGIVYDDLSQHQKAIDDFQQALRIHQQDKDPDGEAKALKHLGDTYREISQYARAVDLYQQALPLFQQAGDLTRESGVLDGLGAAYDNLGQHTKGVDFCRQALAIDRQADDLAGEAKDLTNLGVAYEGLSQYDKATDSFQQALTLLRQVGDRQGVGLVLISLGTVSMSQGQFSQVVPYAQQARALARQIQDRDGESKALAMLSTSYSQLGQTDKAIATSQQALVLARQTQNRSDEIIALGSLSVAYTALGQLDRAADDTQQALLIDQQTGDRSGEAQTLSSLMFLRQTQKQPRLAIFYGKQAINTYQSIRGGLQTMDQKTQQAYLTSISAAYRLLADLLIGQGRLPEAERVLAMLKGQEVSAFVSRDAALAPASLAVSFDPDEQAAQARYEALADPVTKIGQQIDALRALKGRTPAQAQQLVALQNQLTPATTRFQAFLAALPTEMAGPAAPDKARNEQLIQGAQGPLQGALRRMGPGTVALFTLVEPDRCRLIVVTSQTEKAEEYPIKSDDLRRLVFAWRAALQDPRQDPNALGEQLSKILLGPVEADLIGAQATTLLWSLDDVLRYVPVGALYDGHHYLVEKYRSALFTGATLPALGAAPADWGGAGSVLLALGVTRAHTVTNPTGGAPLDFPALPGVDTELQGIARYAGNPGGVLAGTPLEDAQFTQAALRGALAQGFPVVHIASHFDLGTNYKSSFLLLGDGGVLSLADLFGQGGQIFQGVDLLTLSACQTGVGGGVGDGHEVESLASLAQEQGASSILASLWPVSDATTPLLMRAFYQRLAAEPGVSKAEALRQAQIALLHGTLAVSAAPARGTAADDDARRGADAPTFTLDPKAPYAHPYYWAPFVLIGNWR